MNFIKTFSTANYNKATAQPLILKSEQLIIKTSKIIPNSFSKYYQNQNNEPVGNNNTISPLQFIYNSNSDSDIIIFISNSNVSNLKDIGIVGSQESTLISLLEKLKATDPKIARMSWSKYYNKLPKLKELFESIRNDELIIPAPDNLDISRGGVHKIVINTKEGELLILAKDKVAICDWQKEKSLATHLENIDASDLLYYLSFQEQVSANAAIVKNEPGKKTYLLREIIDNPNLLNIQQIKQIISQLFKIHCLLFQYMISHKDLHSENIKIVINENHPDILTVQVFDFGCCQFGSNNIDHIADVKYFLSGKAITKENEFENTLLGIVRHTRSNFDQGFNYKHYPLYKLIKHYLKILKCQKPELAETKLKELGAKLEGQLNKIKSNYQQQLERIRDSYIKIEQESIDSCEEALNEIKKNIGKFSKGEILNLQQHIRNILVKQNKDTTVNKKNAIKYANNEFRANVQGVFDKTENELMEWLSNQF